MFISLSTILNTTVWMSLLILLLLFMTYKPMRLLQLSLPAILATGILILLKFLLPFEFFFTFTIPVRKILPDIYMALRTPVFQFESGSLRIFHIMLGIWIIGSTVLILRMIQSYRKLQAHISRLAPVTDPEILSTLDKINTKFKKPVQFKMVRSPEIISPCITGFFKPVIIFSDTTGDTRKMQHILNHELHHFYRGHLWIKSFGECVRRLYFWNPLIHILVHQMNQILELDADKAATDAYDVDTRIEYMDSLLTVSRLQYDTKFWNPSGINFSTAQTSGLKKRMDYLLHPPETKWSRIHSVLFYVILCSLVALSLFFICEPSAFSEEVEETTLEFNSQNSYLLKREDGTYDLYYNDIYMITVTEIFDPNIPIKEDRQ